MQLEKELNFIWKKKMNIWKLCKMFSISWSTILTFMSGRTELIKLDTLLHICEGFGITLGENQHLIQLSKINEKIKCDLIMNLLLNCTLFL